MNKLFCRGMSVILAVIIAVGCMVFSSAASGMYGDLNNDSKVNSGDALAVLKHSVGSALLTGDNLIFGDVNSDSKINSADALLILQYAVGKISSFPAEGASVPKTKTEILEYYAAAVSKARKDIPAYKLSLSSEAIYVDLSGSMISMMSKEEVEAQKKSMMQKQTYNNLFKQGNDAALANLPAECTVTDPATFADITCKVLADGKYQIDIKFKDDTNPTQSSPIVKMLGLPDKATVIKQMEDEFKATVEGADVSSFLTVKVPTLEYKNCSISCVIDPATGNFVSYKSTSDMVNTVVVTYLIADMRTDTTTRTTFDYSNFIY